MLPPNLEKIREKLAENIHELWVMNKIELGWTYGAVSISQITDGTVRYVTKSLKTLIFARGL